MRHSIDWAGCGRLAAALVACAVLAGWTAPARAQQSWEYSPYQIQVWIARSAQAETPDSVRDEVADVLMRRADSLAGAAWNLEASAAPPRLRFPVVDAIDEVSAEDLVQHGREALSSDKLFLVAIDFVDGAYHLQTRELDCRTRVWGSVVRRRVLQREVLGAAAYSSIAEAFTPIARIENLTDEDKANQIVRARLRAGGLLVGAPSPADIQPGEVLQPIVRRNDRLGEPKKGGIQVMPWTYLQVAGRDRDILTCHTYSGMRSPFSARAGRRTDRYALAVRPVRSFTRLRLQTRGAPPRPLAGYEVFSKQPEAIAADGTVEEVPAERLGQTDWRGVIDIERGDSPLRIVYVKSGGKLLARVPIAPGFGDEVTATLSDDTPRLRAEGFVISLQTTVMDLVAKREVLASRIRKRIEERKFDEAQQLIDEFRALDTRDDLVNLLDQRSGLSSSDRRVQAGIDRLFNDTRRVLGSYLDPKEADQLIAELSAARNGGQAGSE